MSVKGFLKDYRMARPTKRTLKGIALRGNVYHARLTIPKDVRGSLDLYEFTQSLETSDLRVAKIRGETCIRDWKRQITKARGLASPISEALVWKEELNRAKAEYQKAHVAANQFDLTTFAHLRGQDTLRGLVQA